jgi:hypothetical protein
MVWPSFSDDSVNSLTRSLHSGPDRLSPPLLLLRAQYGIYGVSYPMNLESSNKEMPQLAQFVYFFRIRTADGKLTWLTMDQAHRPLLLPHDMLITNFT